MESEDHGKRKEIYTYKAPWNIYGMSFCRNPQLKYTMALSSFQEEYLNTVRIVQLTPDSAVNNYQGHFDMISQFEHPYPPSRIMWCPPSFYRGSTKDVLATSGDYLRLWQSENKSTPELLSLLNKNKHSEFCAPLTSLDWNETDPSMIGTASIDTTCTIWDINTNQAKIQLIAHDKEVYDISFSVGSNIFATVGADGSLRMFDMRSLEHSTILYETASLTGLMRLSWNKVDPNYIATIGIETNVVTVVDIRMPSIACKQLTSHRACVNGVTWAPHSGSHLCSVGDDGDALIWDIATKGDVLDDPILAYSAGYPINSVSWCSSHEDYVAIAYESHVQYLKV